MKDKYDKAIEYLRKHPEETFGAWRLPTILPGGCLFQHCGRMTTCGCLTQIAHDCRRAATPELTKAIREDKRIPDNPERNRKPYTLTQLKVLAEWQRRIDKELGRI